MAQILWKSDIFDKNIDSICVVESNILVTGKESNSILIFDKKGKLIDEWIDDFDRPNGIASYNNLVAIVERDGKCFKLYDFKDRKLINTVEDFKKPYGLTYKVENVHIIFYLTDDGDKTIYELKYNLLKNSFDGKNIWKQLSFDCKLESIVYDKEKNIMLVANEADRLIYVINYATKNIINIVGQRFLDNEPEGIAIWNQYYVFTNQSKTNNCFHFVDKEHFDVQFTLKFKEINNTDGICIDDNHLYAINDDKQLVCVKLN